MRTRIALVAIAPIVIITITVLMQAATAQSARALATPPSGATSTTIAHLPARYPVGRQFNATEPALATSSLLFDMNVGLLSHSANAGAVATTSPAPKAAAASTATPAPPAPAATPVAATGPIDTVSPSERAAWERVAMCEEGGNWHAESSRFSGGLGITRANWDNYGGREFAPEGAMATEDQQIMVAERIQPTPPDRYGCSGW
jgi:hypothetical protein